MLYAKICVIFVVNIYVHVMFCQILSIHLHKVQTNLWGKFHKLQFPCQFTDLYETAVSILLKHRSVMGNKFQFEFTPMCAIALTYSRIFYLISLPSRN
jgi:hypothetical protein